MAFSGCSAGRHAARPAAARELGAGGASAAAAGCRPRRRLLRCRCDAVEQQDGAVVGAPSPLTSKTAQRLKVSMMSLGCPKNVVDGALPHGLVTAVRRCISWTSLGARRAALAAALCWPALRWPARIRVLSTHCRQQTLTPAALLGCTLRVTRQVSRKHAARRCSCRRGDAWRLVQRRLRHHGAQRRPWRHRATRLTQLARPAGFA